MFFLCWAWGKIDDAKMKTACGSDTGVFKGDFGRCPRCSWMLWYAFLWTVCDWLHFFISSNRFRQSIDQGKQIKGSNTHYHPNDVASVLVLSLIKFSLQACSSIPGLLASSTPERNIGRIGKDILKRTARTCNTHTWFNHNKTNLTKASPTGHPATSTLPGIGSRPSTQTKAREVGVVYYVGRRRRRRRIDKS